MSTLTLELPPHKAQTILNLRRWAQVLADPALARFEGRVETDRHGRVIMSPPPAPTHGSCQSEIAYLLRRFMDHGRVITECPISTADGVRAADVAWASPAVMQELGRRVCFPRAPEICVELISPGDTEGEIQAKTALCFNAGAKEVWTCTESGAMNFLGPRGARPMRASQACPPFPRRIELR